MSYQVAQRPQLHPQRPNTFNRPQYQHGPNQPTGLYQYPQGYHNYNQQQTQRNQHYISPLRPIAQKPQPKPEPMDIDPSIRINAINYANRPNLKYARKRQPDSNLSNPPMKAQRNFHAYSPEAATKPEPMDIDPSIRINAINYANRPNLKYARKRQPDSNLSNPPMKAQRNFHVSTSPEEAETSFDNKDNTPPITFEKYGVENPDFIPITMKMHILLTSNF
ncbi:unnamed protein product [Ceratitis capitata]|uniref:(Mediterranean fruit fly) hypothetical protein n=1 Tax=Ceratitis capitata TaxID=7213 RepID=A0A811UUR0_CERCA|nr:unnamed protein product [Ceratitis capitata]